MTAEMRAREDSFRKRAQTLLTQGDELKAKAEAGKATTEERARLAEITKEITELTKFPNACEDPVPGGEQERGSDGGPLVRSRSWSELCQRAGSRIEQPGDAWESAGEFFSAVFSQRFDPRLLQNRAGLTGATGADGGFVIPSFIASSVFDAGLQSEIVRPRARVYAMASRYLSVPCWADVDHSTNTYGGFTSEWAGEGEEITLQAPKLRAVAFGAKKLAMLSKITSEMSADAPSFLADLLNAMQTATSWNLDKALTTGDGASEPEGYLNASCRVVVDKESGQGPDTILAENITQMWSRLAQGSHTSATWVCSPDVLPQLLTMTMGIGEWSRAVQYDSAGRMVLMGRPLLLSEHQPVLGDEGDIALVDFRYYGLGLRSTVSVETSGAPFFSSDEVAIRLRMRLDGKAMLSSAITPANGGATQSPIVVLQARA